MRVITHHVSRAPVYEQMFALSCAWNKGVCEKQGMQFESDILRREPSKNYYREKAAKLVEVMNSEADGAQLLWIDGDVLLVGENIPEIFGAMSGNDIGMVRHGYSEEWNCGVCPMIVSPQIRHLWKSIRDEPNAKLADLEERVRELKDKGVGVWSTGQTARPVEGFTIKTGDMKVKLAELDTIWNEDFKYVTSKTRIIGYHGYSGHAKYDLMKLEIERRASRA